MPLSRVTSARSAFAPGAAPVWAGLTTATRPSAQAARAAVTTVLPTSVPVPLTMSTLIGARPAILCRHAGNSPRVCTRSTFGRSSGQDRREYVAGTVEVGRGERGPRGQPQARAAGRDRRRSEAAHVHRGIETGGGGRDRP